MFDEMIEDQEKVKSLLDEYENINGKLTKDQRKKAQIQLENMQFAIGVLPKVEELKLKTVV